MTLTARKHLADLQLTEAGRPTLRRALGPLNLTTLGIGSVIGTGIFVLTGTAASQNAGPALVLSMIIAAVALRAGRPLLRRAGVDDPGGRQRVHLRLRLVGRAGRLDHRLGPDPGVRAERGHRRRRLVRLLRELPPRPRPVAAAGAHRRARIDRGRRPTARWCPGVFNLPAAAIVLLVSGAARDRHQAVGRRQHGAGGDQGRGAHALRGARRGVRPAGEPDAVHPAQHRRVRRTSAGAACCAARR